MLLQINQDGAGPLDCDIDATSGGTDPNAFEKAEVVKDLPGIVLGLSVDTNVDNCVQIRMPRGMVCSAKVGGAENVCIVRIRNRAPAGPFGGSAAFTQSPAARKRAIAYRLRRRSLEARGGAGDVAVAAKVADAAKAAGGLEKRYRPDQPADA